MTRGRWRSSGRWVEGVELGWVVGGWLGGGVAAEGVGEAWGHWLRVCGAWGC